MIVVAAKARKYAPEVLSSYSTVQRIAVNVYAHADGTTVEVPHVPSAALDPEIRSVKCLLLRPVLPIGSITYS